VIYPGASPAKFVWGALDRGRGAHGIETPKASSCERRRESRRRRHRGGGKWGGGIPLPSRLGGLGERRELPSGVRGGAPAENDF